MLSVAFCLVCIGQDKPQFNTASAGVKATDIEAAMRLLCSQKHLTRDKDGSVSGCSVCPDGAAFAGDNASKLEIYAETPGHFTSVQANNLILSGYGCEPHSNNFGGSYVFSVEAGKARLLHYSAGLITDECHKFAFADGREYLICRGGWGGQGEADAYVFTAAFSAAGTETRKTLLSVRDTTGECGDESQIERSSEIKGLKFVPADTGQITGLTITATMGEVTCGRVAAAEKSKSKGELPGVKSYDVEFVFDGKRFTVKPGSRAALNRLTPND